MKFLGYNSYSYSIPAAEIRYFAIAENKPEFKSAAIENSSKSWEKVFKLLDEISHNVDLFKQTRKNVREKYPELFKTYGSTATT